jgi:hypothetical protein
MISTPINYVDRRSYCIVKWYYELIHSYAINNLILDDSLRESSLFYLLQGY